MKTFPESRLRDGDLTEEEVEMIYRNPLYAGKRNPGLGRTLAIMANAGAIVGGGIPATTTRAVLETLPQKEGGNGRAAKIIRRRRREGGVIEETVLY